MNNPGTTVYVHWYGKLLQGTVVNDHDLFGMVAVRIPLQGCHPVALFTPASVYTTEAEAAVNGGSPAVTLSPQVYVEEDRMGGQWYDVQKFKLEHWDHARNHLRLDAINEFYRLWRIAASTGQSSKPADVPAGSPAVPPSPPPPSPKPSAPVKSMAVQQPSQPQLHPIRQPRKPITATQLSLIFE